MPAERLPMPKSVVAPSKGAGSATKRDRAGLQDSLITTLAAGHLATATQTTYSNIIKAAGNWLEQLVWDVASDSVPSDLPTLNPSGNTGPSTYDFLADPELAHGLTDARRCTPYIIALYLCQRVKTEGRGKSLLQKTHAAFKNHYDRL